MKKKAAKRVKENRVVSKGRARSRPVPLPDKPSDLIRLAVHDLSVVEKLPKRFKVNMAEWHTPNGACKVCFAGAVMAISMKLPAKDSVCLGIDEFYNEDTERKLFTGRDTKKLKALNLFRCGHVSLGLDLLAIPLPMWLTREIGIAVDDYSKRTAGKFKEQMLAIATLLEASGL